MTSSTKTKEPRMTYARCPKCGGLYGPLANDLLLHLKEHGLAVEWYEANTGNVKLVGWLPGTVEFVECGGLERLPT